MKTDHRGMGEIRSFCRAKEKENRIFRNLLKKESALSPLIAEHGAELRELARASIGSLKGVRRLPLGDDGVPYLYRLAQRALTENENVFSEKKLREVLFANGAEYRDEELLLLSSFLIMASVQMYVNTKETSYLRAISEISRIDFSDIFFSFSKAEKIFLSEASGVYAQGSTATKYLYHRRLADYAERTGKDPISAARCIVAKANEKNTHIGEILCRQEIGAGWYFAFRLLMTAALLSVILWMSGEGLWSVVLTLLAAIPVFSFSGIWLEPFFSGIGEKILPSLNGGAAMEQTKVMVSIATFLYGEEKDQAIFDKLEDFCLTNGAPNVSFAVLGDLPQSQRRRCESDEATFAYARARIQALREKYGECFYLFIRERCRSASEDAYIGWERKRGGVLELCRFLRGEKTSLLSFFGERKAFSDIKYLITLDADTNLYIGAVRDLLGMMLHPENQPCFDKARGCVVKGHAVIQPRMIPSLLFRTDSLFASLTGGGAGLDCYARAGFDLYQELFDQGIYCGKGILDIDVFLKACDGFFPRERILSHDLAEGNLLRAALAEEVVLSDGIPKNALSYYMRAHRWIRGDLQVLPYVCRYVRTETNAYIKNPMTPLSKFKIWNNLFRACEPTVAVALLLCGFLLGEPSSFICAAVVFLPLLWQLGKGISGSILHRDVAAAVDSLRGVFFRLSAMAYEGYLFADAAVRVLYRFTVSRKNFLNWTTAFEADHGKGDTPGFYCKRFLPSMLIGFFFFCLPLPLSKLLGLAWMAFPFFMWMASGERSKSAEMEKQDREILLGYTRDAWRYFRDHVDEKTNFLPPDNVQLSPTYAVAMRTSPTNIGMYLLSLLAARDLGLIGKEEFLFRAQSTAKTLNMLRKWNGHLYNWYDLQTLSVLPGDGFVSTVDSGNFVASLIAFCEGAKEYAGESPALLEVISSFSRLAEQTDFAALYDEKRNLFTVGYSSREGKFSDSRYDVFMSEARTASFLAVALRQVPREHYFMPRRRVIGGFGGYGIASWSGTAFEYFMPSIFLPRVRRSLTDTALSYAYRMQRAAAVKGSFFGKRCSVFGISESGYFAFDGAMNYQYRAFGVAGLALDPTVKTGRIVAPYASFLMMENDPTMIMRNLEQLKSFDMYGKYGFYEALDFDQTRVGKGFAVLKSFMAHHIGMSILSATNFLRDDIFVKRFLRNPRMRAARELLAEKMPTTVSRLPEKREMPAERLPMDAEEAIFVPIRRSELCLFPQVALLSNNKTKIFCSSSGHIEYINGREAVCISDFDRFSLGAGLRIYVNIDGTVFPTVPLGEIPTGFKGEFDFIPHSDMIEYHSLYRCENNDSAYEIRFRISVFPNAEFSEFSCKVSGNYKTFFAVLYGEPILTDKKSHLAHKSFSDLFLESEYIGDENVLMFKRRCRDQRKETSYFGVTVTPGEKFSFECMRDLCLPLRSDEGDYALLAADGRCFSDSEGALILPACAVKSTPADFGEQISFFMGESRDADDLLYQMQKCRRKGERRQRARKTGALLHLQYASAGLGAPADAFERFLLGNMIFGREAVGGTDEFAFRRADLWKYSVSGDHPIVLARMNEGTDEAFGRLAVLIGLFKYLCIRGVRYDFVIVFKETDGYARAVRNRIARMIRYAGCENFISWQCGIYLLEQNLMSKRENGSFFLSACADFPLSVPLSDSMKGMEAPALSERLALLLIQKTAKAVLPLPAPKRKNIQSTESGLFHANGFLVKKPHGRAPFAHVLASVNFGTVLTENSLGFTFARNAGMKKLTPHTADGFREDDGEKLILRCYDPFDSTCFRDYDLCASAAWADFCFDRVCYYGKIGGIEYETCVELVGLHDLKKITVSLESRGGEISSSVAYAVSPCLGALPFGFCRYRREDRGVRIRIPGENGSRSMALAVFSPDANRIYTDEAAFRTDGEVFGGRDDIAVVCAEKTWIGKTVCTFFLGAYFSEKQYQTFRKLARRESVTAEGIREKYLSVFSVRSKAPLFDEIVNHWSLYQTVASRIFARSGFYQVSGAYGFRDQLQDALALIPVNPKTAKALILRAAAHQYEQGDVQHWWHPTEQTGIRTRCSDDFLWLPYVTAEYVQQTGDTDILQIGIPYIHSAPLGKQEHERYERAEKSERKESLLRHLLCAVTYGKQYGAHGLPLIGTCDWNDGMNQVGIHGTGESVWLAFFRILVLRKTVGLCEQAGIVSVIEEMKAEEAFLYASLKQYGFDGEWYRRGYYDDGSVLGGKEREDCKIDLLPQAFAAILAHESGYEKDRARQAMKAVEAWLYDKEHLLVRLLAPPFDRDGQTPGYIKGYVPGIRENGGQYTHAAVWAALGFFMIGDFEKATELLFAINPAQRYLCPEIARAYRIEPYVFAGDVYTNPQHVGRGGWSFYTGAAAWYRKVALEILCGYTERGEGFYLQPRLSERFGAFTIEINKKETFYRIDVALADDPLLVLDGDIKEDGENYFFPFDKGRHEASFKVANAKCKLD